MRISKSLSFVKLLFVIMFRKVVIRGKYVACRRIWLLIPLLAMTFSALAGCWWLSGLTSRALLPPPPPDQNLDHFRRNRNLGHYLDNIQLLIEPSSVPCGSIDEVPVIILVTSSPFHQENRQAIRQTWAKYQPTYFLLGLTGHNGDEQLVDTYVEAKQYSDIIVFDLLDHYQNLTLKTALMMQWTLNRCPQAQFMFKTDDDVLVNPWTLERVLKDNPDAKLLGYQVNNTNLHRDEYTKWYVPRWVCSDDVIPQYLSGTGYLISGDYLQSILTAAHQVPLVNLEDVYFTYIVANRVLKLNLTHEKRLSRHKPWFSFDCAYWGFASLHSLEPSEMVHAWAKILRMSKKFSKNKDICRFFNAYFSNDIFLY